MYDVKEDKLSPILMFHLHLSSTEPFSILQLVVCIKRALNFAHCSYRRVYYKLIIIL